MPPVRQGPPNGVPQAVVGRLHDAVDGFPHEFAWAGTPALTLRRAQDGAPTVYATQVRLLDDGSRLFVRFHCADPDVWATHTERNAPLWEEEVVEIFLAPGTNDPRRYVEIQVNPLGTIFDACVSNPDGHRATMSVEPTWDTAGLEVRVGRDAPEEWRVDIAFPWAKVTDSHPPKIWRANFYRIERPRGGLPEYACWSPTMADPPDFHRPEYFGTLLRQDADAASVDLDTRA